MLPHLSKDLNDVVLWQATTTAGSKADVQAITLWHLALACLIGGATFALARKLYGALAIGVLQWFTLEPGDRYAKTFISRYLIMTIGMFVIFTTLRIGWGQVQWLVAAIGLRSRLRLAGDLRQLCLGLNHPA